MLAVKRRLKVRDRMTPDPVTIGPEASLQIVMNLLRSRNIRSVPVIEKGRLVGIVTDRDVRQVAPAYPLFRDQDEIRRYIEQLTVTAAMTADPMTIEPDALLVDAAKILELYRISSLPVVDQKKGLVGMLNMSDVLRAFIEQDEQIAAKFDGLAGP